MNLGESGYIRKNIVSDFIMIPDNGRFKSITYKRIQQCIKDIVSGNDMCVSVSSNLFILDNIATYFAYKELGYKEIPCKVFKKRFERCKKLKLSKFSIIHEKDKEKRRKRKWKESKTANATRVMLWKLADERCYICGRVTYLVDEKFTLQATVDHVVPKSLGGESDFINLRCCCLECNQLKANKMYSAELHKQIIRELIKNGSLPESNIKRILSVGY